MVHPVFPKHGRWTVLVLTTLSIVCGEFTLAVSKWHCAATTVIGVSPRHKRWLSAYSAR